MANSVSLSRLVTVRTRFTRSISLPRDWERKEALEGYILTPSGRDILGRFAAALRGDSPIRAFSVTGPYGSGKSAFALFAAQVLGGRGPIGEHARAHLKTQDFSLWGKLFSANAPFSAPDAVCPVLVTGTRDPLESALASGLSAGLRRFLPCPLPRGLAKQLDDLARRPERTTALVGAFEEALEFITAPNSGCRGLLLVIDELGKFLEYAASHSDEGDVFVLQALAEAAARAEKPFLVLTTLHQALDRYTAHISPGRRQEWAKVQGRFEDIAFEESTDQVLRLLAQAIEHRGPESLRGSLERHGRELAAQAWALGSRIGALEKRELVDLLAACSPLHPSVTVVLGPLFRRLAQNERSLFAFLSSGEPFAFQEFLRTVSWGPKTGEVFRLDRLYDYVSTALGSALFSQHRGKFWAEVQSVLARLHQASPLEMRLAKAVGLLQALGYSAGVPASRDFLKFALSGAQTADNEIEAAILALEKRSIIVYRRHANGYALWEGSDVDIDNRMRDARRAVDPKRELTAFLEELAPPRPLVARRHMLRTGTLRYFEICYADRATLESALTQEPTQADGRIIYCLPLHAEDRKAIKVMLRSASLQDRAMVIAALPAAVFDLKDVCLEPACLRWTLRNTPGLASDATARQELRARLAAADYRLSHQLRTSYAPSQGQRCQWFHRGSEVAFPSMRSFNEFLSDVCDGIYSSTPCWRNELVNRRSLSSAAAAARRNLIEAIFEHPHEEDLGISGTPPERSMYETLLRSSHFHRKQGGILDFRGPDAKAEPAVKDIWRAINRFLAETEAAKLSVERLFSLLRRPPFGLKDGVLPVLLAVTLAHYHAQVALYEEGSFVPRPSASVFERIFRSPEKFDLQRFRIVGPRAAVFQQYADMLTKAGAVKGEKTDLLQIVRPLVRLVKDLPDYVGKTKHLSPTAQSVLRAIREARQPDRLLFVDLPTACDFPAFETKGKVGQDQVEPYFETLRSGLAELQSAYPQLLTDVEHLLIRAFKHTGPLAKLRQEIEHEARLVLNVAVDAKLKSFLLRAIDAGVEDQTWLESIATLLAGKPPTAWDDQDRARFEVQLAATSRTFEHFKVLAYEMQRSGFALLDGDHRMLRVSITVPNGPEVERVVQVPPHLTEQGERAKDGLRRTLEENQLLDNADVSVALLAQLARQLLSETERKEVQT